MNSQDLKRPKFSKAQITRARRQIAEEESMRAARKEVLSRKRQEMLGAYLDVLRRKFDRFRKPLLIVLVCSLISLVGIRVLSEISIINCRREQFYLAAKEFNKLPLWTRKPMEEGEFLSIIQNATSEEFAAARVQMPSGLEKFWIFQMYDYLNTERIGVFLGISECDIDMYTNEFEPYPNKCPLINRALLTVKAMGYIEGGTFDAYWNWIPPVPSDKQLNHFDQVCRSNQVVPGTYAGNKVFPGWPVPRINP